MVSELSVTGMPGAPLFRIGDAVAGLLTLCLVTRLPRRGWMAGALIWCVLAFGVGTAVSALIPLPCAPSARPDCSAPWHDGQQVVHDLLSIGASTGAVVGAWLLWWLLPQGRARLAALALATTSVLLAASQSATMLGLPAPDAGWAQRGQVLAVSGWLVLLGALVTR